MNARYQNLNGRFGRVTSHARVATLGLSACSSLGEVWATLPENIDTDPASGLAGRWPRMAARPRSPDRGRPKKGKYRSRPVAFRGLSQRTFAPCLCDLPGSRRPLHLCYAALAWGQQEPCSVRNSLRTWLWPNDPEPLAFGFRIRPQNRRTVKGPTPNSAWGLVIWRALEDLNLWPSDS